MLLKGEESRGERGFYADDIEKGSQERSRPASTGFNLKQLVIGS